MDAQPRAQIRGFVGVENSKLWRVLRIDRSHANAKRRRWPPHPRLHQIGHVESHPAGLLIVLPGGSIAFSPEILTVAKRDARFLPIPGQRIGPKAGGRIGGAVLKVQSQVGANDGGVGRKAGEGEAPNDGLQLQTVVGGFSLASLPADATIVSAYLALHLQNGSADAPTSLRAYALTRDWEETGVTFGNSQDLWGKGYGSARQDDQQPSWVTFDVTDLVQAWVRGPSPAFGVGVRSIDAQNPPQLAVFDAHETPYLGPRLRIHYIIDQPASIYLPMLVTP